MFSTIDCRREAQQKMCDIGVILVFAIPLGWGNHFFVVQMSLVFEIYKDVNTIYYLWLFFMRIIFL